MLKKLKEVLFVVKLLKGKTSYYHLLKRFEENENYVKEGKCKYCKFNMLDEKCEYYSCEEELKIC